MKKALLQAAGLVAAIAMTVSPLAAQTRGKAALRDGKVSIDYGRPSVQGRDVMAMISPGSYWRMGADTATKLTTEMDLVFEDKTVPKGTYTLVAHFVEAEKWNLVVAQGVGQGFKPEGVLAEVPGRFEKDQESVEQLTIDVKEQAGKVTMTLSWGGYRLSVDFKIGS